MGDGGASVLGEFLMSLHASHTSPTVGLSQLLGTGDSVATTTRLRQDCDTLVTARLTTSSKVAPWEPSAAGDGR